MNKWQNLQGACALVSVVLWAFPGQSVAASPADPQAKPPSAMPSAVFPPTHLSVIPGIGQVALKWSPVDGAATYNLYIAKKPTDATTATTPLMTGITGTIVIVPDLTNDTPYYFAVRAVVSGEVGGSSDEISGKPTKAAAPSDVKPTSKDGQVALSWTSVGATSYEVDQGTEPGVLTPAPELSAIVARTPTVTATVTGLKNKTMYFFVVKAVSAGPTVSLSALKWATPEAAAVPSAILPPKQLTVIPGIGQVALKWSPVDGAATYNVYIAQEPDDAKTATTPLMTGITGTIVIVPNLTNATPYYFAVRAVVSGEVGGSSDEISGKPTKAAAPSDVKPTSKDGQVTLSWTSVGATSYEVDQGTDPGSLAPAPGLRAIVASTPTVTATVTGLKNKTTYFFVVKAISVGPIISPPSALKWATPEAAAAPTPAAGSPKPIDLTKSNCTNLKAWPQAAQVQEDINRAQDAVPGAPKPSVATVNTRDIRLIQSVLAKERQYVVSDPTERTKAFMCNAWLAEYTAAQQTKSSTESLQAFPKFNTSIANNSELVTTHFVSAFMPMWLFGADNFKQSNDELKPYANSRFYNDLGFDISSSVPISSASLADYAKQELLTRNGGLLNMTVSFSGRNYANEAYAWGNRAANLDRLYFLDLRTDQTQPATAKQGLMFLSQGIDVKALKTSLTGTSTLGAQGMAYVGLGFDGPLFLAAEDATTVAKDTTNNPGGMVSLEGYVSENFVNGQALTALVGASNPGHTYFSWGVNLSLYVTNNIGMQVQYAAAQDSGIGRSIGHVAMFTIGYTKTSTQASEAKKATASATKSESAQDDTADASALP
jgi:hypothetical protein